MRFKEVGFGWKVANSSFYCLKSLKTSSLF